MDLRHLIGIIRSWLPLLIVAAILAGAAGFIVSSLQPSVYASSATLIVGESLSNSNPNASQLQVSQSLATTYTAIAKTRPILQKVAEDVGAPGSLGELAKRIDVRAAPDVPLLTITVEDTDPERAAATANALAERLIEASPAIGGRAQEFSESIDAALADTERSIEATRTRVEKLISLAERTAEENAELLALEGRLVDLRSVFATLLGYSSADTTNRLSIVELAVPSTETVGPRTLLNTLLAMAIGLAIILAIAFISDQLDDSIKDPEAVQELTGLGTLGSIAAIKGQRGRSEIYRLVGLLYPRSSVAESYRALRSNIEFSSVDGPIRTLLVTSSAPEEGKTMIACNLAIVFAQAGRRVVLVDADLRRPSVHVMFQIPNTTGMTTFLRDPSVTIASVAQATQEPNLRVVATGPLPPNPTELLGSHRMRMMLEALLAEADLMVFDSPPMQSVADAAVLSALLDGTLVVVDARRSRRRHLRLTMETLQRAGARVLGVVLNRIPDKVEDRYGYYGTDETDTEMGSAAVLGTTTATPHQPS